MAESDEMAMALSVLFYLAAQDHNRDGHGFASGCLMVAAIVWGGIAIIRVFT